MKFLVLLLILASIGIRTLIIYYNVKKEDGETTSNVKIRASSNEILDSIENDTVLRNCLINVHGLDGTSTNKFYSLIRSESIGSSELVSSHLDEGQTLQNVYPDIVYRQNHPDVCALDTEGVKRGRIYYCPDLLERVVNETNKDVLFREWSQYWDLTKPYILQKTSTFDIVLLERLKVVPTFHAILMQHPFRWKPRFKQRVFDQPIIWLDTWVYTLEMLSKNEIKSFAVVNYEMLLLQPRDVLNELGFQIQESCPFTDKIELNKEVITINEKMDDNLFDKCENIEYCRNMMNDLSPLISAFGYGWDKNSYFQPNKLDSNILFSPQKLPSPKLLTELKTVLKKYIKD